MSNNYEIGYGKPPINTRFKPGHSGNGSGRPKKHKENMFDLLVKELKVNLTLKDGKKITKEAALIRQLCNKATNGDYKSGKLILDIASKQELRSLASQFLEKLIKENYISEKNAKDYINSNKVLDTKTVPLAVYNLYRGANTARIKAEMSVTGVLFLASIWDKFFVSIVTTSVLETIANEYSFWEGIEHALDCLNIRDDRRAKLISRIEKDRDILRPSEELYSAALELHTYMTFAVINAFIMIRETYKTIEGYAEAERELLGNKNQEYLLSKAKAEASPRDYESIKNTIEGFNRDYPEFSNFSFNRKDAISLEKRLKKENIHNLFGWYEKAVKANLFNIKKHPSSSRLGKSRKRDRKSDI